MAKVPVASATKLDLEHYARNVLNLEVPAGATEAQLRATIVSVNGEQDIDAAPGSDGVLRSSKAHDRAKATPTTREAASADGKVTILIPENEDESDTTQVLEVAVNGSTMLIPRGRPCAIPKAYYEVLVNSIRRVPVVNRDNAIVGWREVPAVPFQVLAPAA